MNIKADEYIKTNERDIVRSLQACIRFNSVKDTPAPGAPFGEGTLACLEYTLALARSLGFKTTNLDGYVGFADYGEGSETLGILCHLDVVPEGSGWLYPPFAAELVDGKIYGRGTLDDKGPAISALYALAAVKSAGIELTRKVRIIFGLDEESGWGCIKHYKKHEPMPDIAFSPDADYPLVNSERGILHLSLKNSFASSIALNAGTRPNVVPGEAVAIVPISFSDVMGTVDANPLGEGFTVDVCEFECRTKITVHGREAHASTPQNGKNALNAMLCLLHKLPLEGDDAKTVACLNSAFKMDLHGESLALDCEDESGRLTVNPGVMRWNKDGISELTIDTRSPRMLDFETTKNAITEALMPCGLESYNVYKQDGHFISCDSELVKSLLRVYEEMTGEKAKPLAIGGGTYARALENAVAFGCMIEGHDASAHMPNEFISIDDHLFNTRMIASAIIALASK